MRTAAYRITFGIGLLILVYGIFWCGGLTAEAVSTGYHLEKHTSHRVNVEHDTSQVWNSAGNACRVDCYHYYYTCGGRNYPVIEWNKYQFIWGNILYEAAIYGEDGTVVQLINLEDGGQSGSYEAFRVRFGSYLSTTGFCPGYQVANSYTVAYDSGGGQGTMASQSAVYDRAFRLRANTFVRTGYDFCGWTDTVTGTQYEDQANVKNLTAVHGRVVTLRAMWNAQSYTVTFHANGGSVSEKRRTVTYGSTYGQLPVPTRTGYTFQGWYTQVSGGTRVLAKTTVTATANHTLYARWKINRYTVTYDKNGGDSVSKVSDTRNYGASVDLTVTASKKGYSFVGWALKKNAKVELTAYTVPARDITLYALYSIPVSDIAEQYVKSSDLRKKMKCYSAPDNLERFYRISAKTDDTEIGVFARDYAGNEGLIYGTGAVENYITHTTYHMLYEPDTDQYVVFDTRVVSGLGKGTAVTTEYITPPAGYAADHKDEDRVASKDIVTYAYYHPIRYTLSFDPNGGSCDMECKSIPYGSLYGELPAAQRIGHSFAGWYTKKDGGSQKKSSDWYSYSGDSTLYAHWQVKCYTVTYDYVTNGGGCAERVSANVEYGSRADLSVAAEKNGWQHIGWNTDPNAEVGLDTITVADGDITLYAIFQKEIQVEFVDQSEEGTRTRQQIYTIHNRETQVVVPIPEQTKWAGWTSLGWTVKQEADGAIDAAEGSEYIVNETVIFYGRYEKEISVTYDTNGSGDELPDEIYCRQYNAAGNYKDPQMVLANAPLLTGNSFVGWQRQAEPFPIYREREKVSLDGDTVFVAQWDAYPNICAYDRYFTLEQARDGFITESVLLQKVTATDREDGTLINGRNVQVVDYDPKEYTDLTQECGISVTYRAVDHFGNAAVKMIMVYVVEHAMADPSVKQYVRFISKSFYQSGNELKAPEEGGLENTSIWRLNSEYGGKLKRVLENQKTDEVIIEQNYAGRTYEITKPGSGIWQQELECWCLGKDEIQLLRNFVHEQEPGTLHSTEAVEKFYLQFGKYCRTR